MTNEEIYALLTEEQKKALLTFAAKTLIPTICEIGEMITTCFSKAVEQYPNMHIVWLAFYHKKERVRKKNYRRVMSWVEKRLQG